MAVVAVVADPERSRDALVDALLGLLPLDARPGEDQRHSPGRAVGGLLAWAGCWQLAGVDEIRVGVTSDGPAVRRRGLVADDGPVLQRL